MRTTKEILNIKINILNDMLDLEKGSQYFVGYENGMAHIFKEAGNGRITIQYGMTKREIARAIDIVINVLERSKR